MFGKQSREQAKAAAEASRAEQDAQRARQDAAAWAETCVLAYRYSLLQQALPHEQLRGVMVKAGEQARLVVPGVQLMEPRRPPAQWVTTGASVRVMKGVYWRVGAGQVIPRQDELTIIDSGTFVVTDARCLFVGQKRSTEWQYAKLLGYTLDGIPGTAIFNVSNRQKARGVVYPVEWEAAIDTVIAATIARFQGVDQHRAFVASMRDHAVRALSLAGQPVPADLIPPPPPPPPPPRPSAPPSYRPSGG